MGTALEHSRNLTTYSLLALFTVIILVILVEFICHVKANNKVKASSISEGRICIESFLIAIFIINVVCAFMPIQYFKQVTSEKPATSLSRL